MPSADQETVTATKKSVRLHNFSAGPAVLPVDVLQEVRDEILAYGNVGASVMEISHRSGTYTEIEQDAKRRIRALLGVGDEWHVLFLQGGASMQFYQVPLNFLADGASADYLVTGRWSIKALNEAEFVGAAQQAASSEDRNFSYIPDPSEWNLDSKAAYVHFTSNNTVVGTQFGEAPDAEVPLVCDASSDFLSRPIDMDRYGLIYAGAQKNVGPAGATLVLIRNDFLEGRRKALPTMLDYGTHIEKLYNTPPVFAVYVIGKVLRWLEDQGGLSGIQDRNERKAGKLYSRIDRTDFYSGTAEKASRSKMNVTFRLPNEEFEARFLNEAMDFGLLALKGHRSVGGLRASIYNACPEKAVDALVSFMDDFEQKNG